jgi:hypothetical protein
MKKREPETKKCEKEWHLFDQRLKNAKKNGQNAFISCFFLSKCIYFLFFLDENDF